jgi:hypothetical protein
MPQVFELCSILISVYEKRIEYFWLCGYCIRDRKPLPSPKPQTLCVWSGAPGVRFSTQTLLEIRAIGLIENSPSYRLDGSPGRIRVAILKRRIGFAHIYLLVSQMVMDISNTYTCTCSCSCSWLTRIITIILVSAPDLASLPCGP